MRIVELLVENVKRISAVLIRPEGDVITIGGENGAGKTSVMDAIAYAIGGKSLVPAEPIRRGEIRAEVHVDLGDITVNRVFSRTGSHLTVKNAEGVPVTSPQTLLDNLAGKLTFDPLEFARMAPAKQAAVLKELVGLDFATLDRDRAVLYEERRVINRDVKASEAQMEGLARYPMAPKEEISTASLLDKVREARIHNETNTAKRVELADATRTSDNLCDRANDTQRHIEALEKEHAQFTERLRKALRTSHALSKAAEELKDVDEDAIHTQIAAAGETNKQVQANQQRAEAVVAFQAQHKESEALSKKITGIDREKEKALAEAPFPIEGLAFDIDGVRYQETLFAECSEAERIRVSAAIGLAMHPKLRVLFIRAGEKLDKTNRAELASWAAENDVQLWIEDCRAQETGEATVIIEDGTVKGQEPGSED